MTATQKALEIMNSDPMAAKLLAEINRIADEENLSEDIREGMRELAMLEIFRRNKEAVAGAYFEEAYAKANS